MMQVLKRLYEFGRLVRLVKGVGAGCTFRVEQSHKSDTHGAI